MLYLVCLALLVLEAEGHQQGNSVVNQIGLKYSAAVQYSATDEYPAPNGFTWNNRISGHTADWTSVWITQLRAGMQAANTQLKTQNIKGRSKKKHPKKHHHDKKKKLVQDTGADTGVSCLDENGHPVDWWILYKLPEMKPKKPRKHKKHNKNAFKKTRNKNKNRNKTKDSNIVEGTAYVYMLSSGKSKDWTLSDKSVEDPDSVPGRTLAPIYQNRSDLFYALYNDEHPDGPTSFDLGHTKGVVFGDAVNAVWLIHSVPHYPPYPNQTYGYPHTGHRYGQSYMCQSVPTATLDSIGKQLTYNEPYLYAVNLPAWTSAFPNLQLAAHGKHIKKAPFYSTEAWETKAGVKVTSFAKFSKFGKDLYADLVAPSLQIPLLVETWPNGRGRMSSNCSVPFVVENIAELDFPGVNGEDFTTKHDHAKWAISLDEKTPFVCVGDINRMETQRKRGGGTACFEDIDAWTVFRNTIKDVEACPKP